MKISLILLFIMLTFNACATKNAQQSQNPSSTTNAQVDENFDDEYVEHEKVFDPLSGYNDAMTSFNDGFYTYVLEPTAKGYKTVVPSYARKGISNVFDNLMFPIRFVNNLLQLKFQNASEELGRFVFNSTFGLLGIMDVASMHTSWEKHDEDFGQTLGHYGVGSGFHVVLPLFGPSNVRDILGSGVDGFLDPTFSTKNDWKIPNNLEKSMGLKTLNTVNETSFNMKQYESIKKDAIELYPFLRDLYESKRNSDIKE
jgi:phospholipid-binding lipoprotein MlaA